MSQQASSGPNAARRREVRTRPIDVYRRLPVVRLAEASDEFEVEDEATQTVVQCTRQELESGLVGAPSKSKRLNIPTPVFHEVPDYETATAKTGVATGPYLRGERPPRALALGPRLALEPEGSDEDIEYVLSKEDETWLATQFKTDVHKLCDGRGSTRNGDDGKKKDVIGTRRNGAAKSVVDGAKAQACIEAMTPDVLEALIDALENATGPDSPVSAAKAVEMLQTPRPPVRGGVGQARALDAATSAACAPCVHSYWLAKRKALGKPLLRRFWPKTAPTDTNPHCVFRPREKERYKLRKHRKNDVDAFRKLQQLRRDFDNARDLCALVLRRERLKRLKFDAQRGNLRRALAALADEYALPLDDVVDAKPGPAPAPAAAAETGVADEEEDRKAPDGEAPAPSAAKDGEANAVEAAPLRRLVFADCRDDFSGPIEGAPEASEEPVRFTAAVLACLRGQLEAATVVKAQPAPSSPLSEQPVELSSEALLADDGLAAVPSVVKEGHHHHHRKRHRKKARKYDGDDDGGGGTSRSDSKKGHVPTTSRPCVPGRGFMDVGWWPRDLDDAALAPPQSCGVFSLAFQTFRDDTGAAQPRMQHRRRARLARGARLVVDKYDLHKLPVRPRTASAAPAPASNGTLRPTNPARPVAHDVVVRYAAPSRVVVTPDDGTDDDLLPLSHSRRRVLDPDELAVYRRDLHLEDYYADEDDLTSEDEAEDDPDDTRPLETPDDDGEDIDPFAGPVRPGPRPLWRTVADDSCAGCVAHVQTARPPMLAPMRLAEIAALSDSEDEVRVYLCSTVTFHAQELQALDAPDQQQQASAPPQLQPPRVKFAINI